jgi:ribosome assembly protein YihI (activator of Der GTPase)
MTIQSREELCVKARERGKKKKKKGVTPTKNLEDNRERITQIRKKALQQSNPVDDLPAMDGRSRKIG